MDEGSVARVLQDFLTVADGELTISKGDIVQVITKVDRHWCYGCSYGKLGNFPINNLMKIDTPSIDEGQELFVAHANFHSQQPGDLSFSKGDLIVGLEKVDSNWWQGMIEERIGIFPITYTWTLDSTYIKAKGKSVTLNLKAKVKMNMTAKLEDEMDLHQGEIVTITEIIDKNWYRGVCGDRRGTFPSAYVQLIDDATETFPGIDQSSSNTNQHRYCNTLNQSTSSHNPQSPDIPPLISFSPEKEVKPKPATVTNNTDPNDDVFMDEYFKLNMPTMFRQESIPQVATCSASNSTEYGQEKMSVVDGSSHNNSKMEFQSSVEVDIVSYGLTLYPFYAQFENELSFHEGEIVNLIRHVDKFWIEGKIDDRKGIFPTNYVNILVDCDEQPGLDLEPPNSLPEILTPNSFAKALYNFDAQMNGDLTVRENQVVLIVDQVDDDWCKVKDQTGNIGLCPRNHLALHSVPGDRHSLALEHTRTIDLEDFTAESLETEDCNLHCLNENIAITKNVDSIVKFQRSKSISSGKTVRPFSSRSQASSVTTHHEVPFSSKFVFGKKERTKPSRRHSLDRMPHRPAPPIPVPGQEPVRRMLTRPVFNDTLSCSTLIEEKTCVGEKTDSRDCLETVKEDHRKKNLEQRQNVISELVFTEKEYVRDLKITYETFNLHNPSILESRGIDVKVLFGNILDVMHLADDLLDSLLLAMKGKDDEDQCIGPCFLEMTDRMKCVYGQYCMNHDNALTLLEKYATNQEIGNLFEKGLETLRYQIACFNMGSILIKPVQRILKYPLILNELIKCTEDYHKDKPTLLKAVKCVTEVATSINEGKRRKDIVSKYLEDGNTTISSKMSRISLHSVAKKSSRIGIMLTSSLGFGNATKDPVFDEHEILFHSLEKTVTGFVQNVELFLSHQHEEVMMQMDIAECIGHFYQDANITVNQFHKIQHLVTTSFWPHFKNMVDTRVLTPLNTLIDLFQGPAILIQKRNNKLLDYNGCIAKAEKNKENRLIQDELYSAKNNYEALNSHLLEELPPLICLATELFIDCLSAFVTARKLLSGKTTKQYVSLMEMPAMKQGHGDPLESFATKHSLVLNQLGRFSFGSKNLKTDTLGKRSSKTSPLPAPRGLVTEPIDVPLQSPSQRAYLQSRYAPNMLYQIMLPHVAREPLELTITIGHLVAVIKKQNPMGDSTMWYVDDGAVKGFLPNNCMEPFYSSGVVLPPPTNEISTPLSSRGGVRGSMPINSSIDVRRSISPAQSTEAPPSYEEVVNDTDKNTCVYAEIPETAQHPIYAEIPECPETQKFYYAMYDFESNGPHSLSIKSGQVVNVLHKQDLQGNTEWWFVEDRFGGKGYVPGNFLGKYRLISSANTIS